LGEKTAFEKKGKNGGGVNLREKGIGGRIFLKPRRRESHGGVGGAALFPQGPTQKKRVCVIYDKNTIRFKGKKDARCSLRCLREEGRGGGRKGLAQRGYAGQKGRGSFGIFPRKGHPIAGARKSPPRLVLDPQGGRKGGEKEKNKKTERKREKIYICATGGKGERGCS